MARNIAIPICICTLIALFLFPHQRLFRLCDSIETRAQSCIEAVFNEDWATGHAMLEEMLEQYEQDKQFVHALLNHQCIEDLEAAIRSCLRLFEVQDKPQSLLELEFIITHVRYLKSIEQFQLSNLL